MITFANRAASTIKVGDLMRQADENKRHTDFYHFKATRVFKGKLVTPIHDANGQFIGDRLEDDVVVIDWSPVEKGKPFSIKYEPKATVEIATQPVADTSQLLATEEHAEEL